MRIGMLLDMDFFLNSKFENEARTLIAHGHDVVLFCCNLRNKSNKEKLVNYRLCYTNS